jgi:hypothetical protein
MAGHEKKECCNNCGYSYEEYGWLLCKCNEDTMDDVYNEKCEDYVRKWEGSE